MWCEGTEAGETLEGQVLEMTQGGMGRIEIGAALRLTAAALEALEGERPGLAMAMGRAGLSEQAWAMPRAWLACAAPMTARRRGGPLFTGALRYGRYSKCLKVRHFRQGKK